MPIIETIDRPLIGVSGSGGYSGSSGLDLSMIGISLRDAANASDDYPSGKTFIQACETNALNKVIGDLKKEIGKTINFHPVFDTISKHWQGTKNECKVYDDTKPFGLKIENPCRDNYRKNILDWIEVYTDSAYNTYAYVIDNDVETKIECTLVKGLNRIYINYTFEHEIGYFWIKLCNGAIAYQITDCCNNVCHCTKCSDIYQVGMVDDDDQCERLMDYEGEFYESLGVYNIVNPAAETLDVNVLGYQISTICSYDWLFRQFQNELAQAVLINIGIQVYEQSKFTERFNPWVEAANSQADHYLEKWLGSRDRVTGQWNPSEYTDEIKSIANMMVNFINKSDSPCFSCKTNQILVQRLP